LATQQRVESYSLPTIRSAAIHLTQGSSARQSFTNHLIVLVPILMVYCALALFRIDHQSLWLDEVLSLKDSHPDQPFLTHERWFGGRGPLYPALLQLWLNWGTTEFAVRSLSALFGGISICLGYLLAVRLCNRRVALFGVLLLATSPFFIWYSQEARYITLMITTAIVATYTFYLALLRKCRGCWFFYCCSLIIAIAAFVVNIFLPVAHGFYVMLTHAHRPVLWKWLVCVLFVFTLALWWANDGQLQQPGGHLQRLLMEITATAEKRTSAHDVEGLSAGPRREFMLMALPYTFFAFSTGFSLGPSLRELHVAEPLAALPPHALIVLCSGLLFGGLFVLGSTDLWRHRPETGRLLALWLAVPIMGALAVSLVVAKMPYNVRYVAIGFPAYLLILAVGINSIRGARLQIGLLAAVLMMNGVALANYYFNERFSREDTRSAARYLEASAHPGDIVVALGTIEPLQYYYRGGVLVVDGGDILRGRQSPPSDRLKTLTAAHNRVWLVAIRPWQVDSQGGVKAAFDARYSPVEHKKFPGIDIFLYRFN
jgi:mannosyltransferase